MAVNNEDVLAVESLCMRCHENGLTRLLLTDIPHFKQIVISSFECSHCGHQDREVRNVSGASELGGVTITLDIRSAEDLCRKIVKSEAATIRVPHLDFEIPSHNGEAINTTVEGIFVRAVDDLEQEQDYRKTHHPELHQKIESFLEKLKECLTPSAMPFKLELEDPTGNSIIEPLSAPGTSDEQLHISRIPTSSQKERTSEVVESKAALVPSHLPTELINRGWDLNLSIEDNIVILNRNGNPDAESLVFDVLCPHCNALSQNKACIINIPGFRECMIMAFICEDCGSRSNEVRPVGAYGEKAKIWSLMVTDASDLNRDILKADTAALKIPKLELELAAGTMGGIFTTVEGLLLKIHDSLYDSRTIFAGDSADACRKEIFAGVLQGLKNIANGDSKYFPLEIILDDAADWSMIAPLAPSIEEDSRLTCHTYERTEEQNDDLGLTDMKTENHIED